jgi:hypothetical protein
VAGPKAGNRLVGGATIINKGGATCPAFSFRAFSFGYWFNLKFKRLCPESRFHRVRAQRTIENSPVILSLGSVGTETKSAKRTAEKVRGSDDYHSAVRFSDYQSCAPIPSSKLLGYYHSSALRTENSTFWAKPVQACLRLYFAALKAEL